MRFTVTCERVPIGIVHLTMRGLAAAPMRALPGYAAIRAIVRAGSEALLELGFYGAALLTSSRAMEQEALARVAELRMELVDGAGLVVPTTFVNLIEAPVDQRVVAVVRFPEAAIGARLGSRGVIAGARAHQQPP